MKNTFQKIYHTMGSKIINTAQIETIIDTMSGISKPDLEKKYNLAVTMVSGTIIHFQWEAKEYGDHRMAEEMKDNAILQLSGITIDD